MNNKIISFDIYDTLIERILPTEKIFKLLSIKYNVDDFYKIRLTAEKKAREKYSYGYTIYNIYEFIDLDDKNSILEDEIKYEIENTVKNPVGEKLYNSFIKKYKMICTSDMYFTKEILKRILSKNGYNLIDKVYVSCEYNASKRNRKLFKIIRKEFKNHSIVHIGDSIRSDFFNAIFSGLKAKYIGKNNKNNYSKLLTKEEYLYYIGYHIYGPMTFEFCAWINNNRKNKKLLFLSREGEIIRNCYNRLFGENEEMIYVSRKSVTSGILHEMIKIHSLDKIIKIIKKKRPETLEELLIRMNFSRYKDIFDDSDLCKIANAEVVKIATKKIYDNIDISLKNTEKNGLLFDEYIKNKINQDSIFVDVGWNGSMQKIINEYLNKDGIKVEGLYLGCLNSEHKNGFLFNTNGSESNDILNYSGILELIFMPNYGSVINYKKSNSKVEPIFDKCEFSENSLKLIKIIQNGFTKYVDDRKKISLLPLYDNKEIRNIINKIGINPSHMDMKCLGEFDFYDNGKVEKLLSIKSGLLNGFMKSEWKVGFLKKYFKIPLPYNKLLLLIRRRNKND